MKKKLKKKLLFFFIIFMFIFSLAAATQIFAKNTGYNRILGNYIEILEYKVYLPWKYISWSQKFSQKAPKADQKASSAMFGIMIFSLFIIIITNKEKKKLISHGSAEFASTEEIDLMGLNCNKEDVVKRYEESGMDLIYKEKTKTPEEYYVDGVIIGRDEKNRVLLDNGSEHILLMAPTRSGKGVGVIIPTLLTWKGSCVVNDIKGENWDLTAPYRRSIGQMVLKFMPTALTGSCSYNPLAEVNLKTPTEQQEVRNIVEIIIVPAPNDTFFAPSAINFLVGVILYVLYSKKNASLNDVYNFITSPSFTMEEKLKKMISGDHLGEDDPINLFETIYKEVINIDGEDKPKTHPTVSRIGADMLGRTEKERSGIISSALTEITLFSDPIIAQNTRKSDFRIKDLMNYKNPVSLYFVSPPKSIKLTALIMKILLTQIVFILADQMEFSEDGQNKSFKHRLLLLIDELPAMGKIPLLESSLAYIAGYGLKALIIAQDMFQLQKIYSRENSFMSNCKTSIFFTPNEAETSKIIENRLGKETIQIISKSYKGFKYFSDWNYSESLTGRSLKTASEISKMPKDRSIIFIAGEPPIYGKKIFWFNEKHYKSLQKREKKLLKSESLYREDVLI